MVFLVLDRFECWVASLGFWVSFYRCIAHFCGCQISVTQRSAGKTGVNRILFTAVLPIVTIKETQPSIHYQSAQADSKFSKHRCLVVLSYYACFTCTPNSFWPLLVPFPPSLVLTFASLFEKWPQDLRNSEERR